MFSVNTISQAITAYLRHLSLSMEMDVFLTLISFSRARRMLCSSLCLFSVSSSLAQKALRMSSLTKVTSYLLLKRLDGRLYLGPLLHKPVSGLVSAQLNVGPHVSVGQAGAGHLMWRILLPDGVLEVPDHCLQLRNLVHCLLQVGLQLPGGLLALLLCQPGGDFYERLFTCLRQMLLRKRK